MSNATPSTGTVEPRQPQWGAASALTLCVSVLVASEAGGQRLTFAVSAAIRCASAAVARA